MKYQQLSLEERYTIKALLNIHKSLSFIADQLDRSKSTISREIRRNLDAKFCYYGDVAHRFATARRKRSRRGTNFTKEQWEMVLFLLSMKFSPEQISNTLKRFDLFSISHETIYQYLLYDKKKGGALHKNLRIVPKRRRKRYNSHDSRGRLAGKRHISERPAYIDDRSTIGHWEGDTVVGPDRRHCIVTLVERKTGFVIIKKLTARTSEQVTAACIQAIREHGKMIKTITFDNGTEFHGYKEIERVSSVICYFATPYHSWERGTNENINGLIRQYLPKKASMKGISQSDCDRIAYALNTRPRKRHCYKTPEELYYGKDTALHLMLEPKTKIIFNILNTFYILLNAYILLLTISIIASYSSFEFHPGVVPGYCVPKLYPLTRYGIASDT